MLSLIYLIVDICRFRKNPQDLPSSNFLKYTSIASYMAIGLSVSLIHQTIHTSIVTMIIDTGLMLGLAYGGLWVREFENRITQTVTALAATGAFFGLLGAPLLAFIPDTPTENVNLAQFLLLALIMWNISVIGHILRHTLTIPFWAGFGIAVLYYVTYIKVMRFLSVVGMQ